MPNLLYVYTIFRGHLHAIRYVIVLHGGVHLDDVTPLAPHIQVEYLILVKSRGARPDGKGMRPGTTENILPLNTPTPPRYP